MIPLTERPEVHVDCSACGERLTLTPNNADEAMSLLRGMKWRKMVKRRYATWRCPKCARKKAAPR